MKTSTYFITFTIILVSFFNLFSQNINENFTQEKETNGYLVYFDPDISKSKIDSIMQRYNSHELWMTQYSRIRYWTVDEFPFTIDDSIAIFTIDDLYDVWINDGNDEYDNSDDVLVGSFSFNYDIRKVNPGNSITNDNESNQNYCPQYFTNQNTGDNSIVINILDTGFDFKNNNTLGNMIENGYDFVNNNPIAQDNNGHGTHIASIIKSLVNGGSVSVMETKTHNFEGKGKLSDIIQAIDYSIEQGANIINASWSYLAEETENKTPMQIAIETAGDYGILFVAAAGNDAMTLDGIGLKAFPASFSSKNILTVSSNSCDSTLSFFSNYGKINSDICAIGENIPGFVLNGQIAMLSGTSQATAYVSAVAAILGSYLPDFDPVEVKNLILDGAKKTTKLKDSVLSQGVVDLESSMELINNNSQNSNSFAFLNSSNQEIGVYPNPFSDYVSISINSEKRQNSLLEIYSQTGKVVYRKNIAIVRGKNEIRVNGLSDLNSGIYFIKFNNLTEKVLKTK